MTFPILASLLVRLVVLLPFQLLRLSLATPSRWTPLALSVFLHCVEIGRAVQRNAETDLVCRLLLEKKKKEKNAGLQKNKIVCECDRNHTNTISRHRIQQDKIAPIQ